MRRAQHLRLVTADDTPTDALTAFLADLSVLTVRHGIAVSDGAELYLTEPDDLLFSYHADGDSRLIRK